jgi:alpha-tubulin suppressor-like RCC1 family protein
LANVVAIAAGYWHNLALRDDGTVAAWGAGLTNSGVWPVLGQALVPADLSDVVAIATGGTHSLALKGDGTVVAWGDNSSGQTNVPPALSNVVSLAAETAIARL